MDGSDITDETADRLLKELNFIDVFLYVLTYKKIVLPFFL